MSRVLKFRIWDKASKGYMRLGATGLDARNGDVIDYYNEGNRLGGPEEYDVEQYTGLTDKNGKEIYEGDIVRYRSDILLGHAICIVTFYSCRWTLSQHDAPVWTISEGDSENIEVIGNIHENKELWGESV